MLTKKHFKSIAELINKHTAKSYQIIVINKESEFLKELCEYFKTLNPNFDDNKFMEACLK